MKKINIYRDEGEVDISMINAFEEKIGYTFPDCYKLLLSNHNALYPEKSIFDFYSQVEDKVTDRDVVFLGYGAGVTSASRIDRFQDHDVYGREGVITIGMSANGDYICFDYRNDPKTDTPPVVLMLHDCAAEDGKLFVCPVADTFEEFMDSLYEFEDEE